MVEISTGALIYAMLVLILIFLLYEKGKKKYQPFCELLDKEEYRLKELMTIGFSLMDMIRYSYASNFDRKLRKQIKELKEEEYAEFYLRATWAAAATYFALGVFLSALFSLVTEGIMIPIAVVGFGFVMAYTAFMDVDKKIQERHTSIELDLPDFVNKLLILSGAGLSLKAAMAKIAKEMDKDTPFYEALKHSVFLMENGETMERAMDVLCMKCNLAEVRRLSSVLLQNMHRGGTDVLIALQEISRELWNNRRAVAKRMAEQAGTTMLFPIMLMLLAVILVVAAPAVMSLSF